MPEEDVSDAEANEGDFDDQEAMQRLQEEIGRLAVADHVLLMMHSLSSLAVDRLGMGPDAAAHRDLQQAGLAIDAFKALLGVLEGKRPAEEVSAHRSVLSQLQIAYVGALSQAPSSSEAAADDSRGDTPEGGEAEPEADGTGFAPEDAEPDQMAADPGGGENTP